MTMSFFAVVFEAPHTSVRGHLKPSHKRFNEPAQMFMKPLVEYSCGRLFPRIEAFCAARQSTTSRFKTHIASHEYKYVIST